MFTFQRTPFLLLFLCLGTGILLGGWLDTGYIPILISLVGAIFFIVADHLSLLKGRGYFIFLAALLVALGCAHRQQYAHEGQAQMALGKHEQGKAFVVDVSEVKKGESEWVRVLGTIRFIQQNSGYLPSGAGIVLFVKNDEDRILTGTRLFVTAPFESIRNKGNPGEFDAETFWNNRKVGLISFVNEDQYSSFPAEEPGLLDGWIDKVRNYCVEAFSAKFTERQAAVLSAIVLGEKSQLDTETKESFMNTGAMHVLAVSGLHIGLILYLLMFVAERFSSFLSRRTALLILILFFWFYAFLTGASPSVVRAVFMFSMLAISQLLSRKYEPVNVLFFTAFVLVMIDPYTIYDIGFQLSYLAMLGIFVFYEPIASSIKVPNKWLKKAWEGTAIGFAAQICTTPLSLFYFKQFPNYFILSNLGLMITSGLILGLGIAFLLVAYVPVLSTITVFVLGFIIDVTLNFLAWVESLPGAVAYGYDLNFGQFILLFLGTVFLFRLISVRYAFIFSFVCLVCGIGWVAVDRFSRMELSEVRVLNHSKPVIIVKEKDRIDCFYKVKDTLQFEKVKLLAESYNNVHPGTVRYHDISGKKWKFGSLTLEDREDRIILYRGGEGYLIESKPTDAHEETENYVSIGMPWVTSGVDHSLKDGSLQLFGSDLVH